MLNDVLRILMGQLVGQKSGTSSKSRTELRNSLIKLASDIEEDISKDDDMSEPEQERAQAVPALIRTMAGIATDAGVQGVMAAHVASTLALTLTLLGAPGGREAILQVLGEEGESQDDEEEVTEALRTVTLLSSYAALRSLQMLGVPITGEGMGAVQVEIAGRPPEIRDASEMPPEVRAKAMEMLASGRVDFSEEAEENMARDGLSKEEIIDALKKAMLN